MKDRILSALVLFAVVVAMGWYAGAAYYLGYQNGHDDGWEAGVYDEVEYVCNYNT